MREKSRNSGLIFGCPYGIRTGYCVFQEVENLSDKERGKWIVNIDRVDFKKLVEQHEDCPQYIKFHKRRIK